MIEVEDCCELIKFGIPREIVELIHGIYLRMCEEDSLRVLKSIYRTHRRTVHLSDFPNSCWSIDRLEHEMRNTWRRPVHRCCNNTGVMLTKSPCFRLYEG